MRAPKEAAVGEPIPVRVVIRNTGPVPMKTVRVVETVAAGGPLSGRTELFITPGFEFRRVDHLDFQFAQLRKSLVEINRRGKLLGQHLADIFKRQLPLLMREPDEILDFFGEGRSGVGDDGVH